ncbi:interferon-induced protein 44-like [Sinocyclocheilus anshuiensis]|uniref:interferon-induced protein 44-like n=1 Tax=Sinocyclocheilus anshuiensis TaxID=1608454 RepID=UPI0007BA7794|nr:PREDICTED: interferon-induced protein 44-like [Sinocyclocheilus anshuiensis]
MWTYLLHLLCPLQLLPHLQHQNTSRSIPTIPLAATELPPHWPWDCVIDLLPGATLPKGHIYPLSIREQKAMEEYKEEALKQESIRSSMSPAFSPEQPIGAETVGFLRKPSTNDKVHCVVFVIDGSKVGSYAKSFAATFQQLREHISNLVVHQVALLTHVDQVCNATGSDITKVYKSKAIQQAMVKAGELLGMATSYIVPVKSYCSELDLDENTDILLLKAVDHILQYVNLYFQDDSD